jgi:hypothetical protein
LVWDRPGNFVREWTVRESTGNSGPGMDGTGKYGKFWVREWTVRECTGNFSYGNGRYGNVREIFRTGMDGTGMYGKFFVREWTVRECTGNFSYGNGRYGKSGNSRTVPYRTGNFPYRGNTNYDHSKITRRSSNLILSESAQAELGETQPEHDDEQEENDNDEIETSLSSSLTPSRSTSSLFIRIPITQTQRTGRAGLKREQRVSVREDIDKEYIKFMCIVVDEREMEPESQNVVFAKHVKNELDSLSPFNML